MEYALVCNEMKQYYVVNMKWLRKIKNKIFCYCPPIEEYDAHIKRITPEEKVLLWEFEEVKIEGQNLDWKSANELQTEKLKYKDSAAEEQARKKKAFFHKHPVSRYMDLEENDFNNLFRAKDNILDAHVQSSERLPTNKTKNTGNLNEKRKQTLKSKARDSKMATEADKDLSEPSTPTLIDDREKMTRSFISNNPKAKKAAKEKINRKRWLYPSSSSNSEGTNINDLDKSINEVGESEKPKKRRISSPHSVNNYIMNEWDESSRPDGREEITQGSPAIEMNLDCQNSNIRRLLEQCEERITREIRKRDQFLFEIAEQMRLLNAKLSLNSTRGNTTLQHKKIGSKEELTDAEQNLSQINAEIYINMLSSFAANVRKPKASYTNINGLVYGFLFLYFDWTFLTNHLCWSEKYARSTGATSLEKFHFIQKLIVDVINTHTPNTLPNIDAVGKALSDFFKHQREKVKKFIE